MKERTGYNVLRIVVVVVVVGPESKESPNDKFPPPFSPMDIPHLCDRLIRLPKAAHKWAILQHLPLPLYPFPSASLSLSMVSKRSLARASPDVG